MKQSLTGSSLAHTIDFRCPSCRHAVESSGIDYACPMEGHVFKQTKGIPDFILPDRRNAVDEFLSFYNIVRESESWGSSDSRYYLELPYKDTTRRHSSIWRLRARTFDSFVGDLERSAVAAPLAFLDLGAGNCWLSLRLAQKGHRGFAVDTNVSSGDGLGVFSRIAAPYPLSFTPVRAEFDFLPFCDSAFDVIVFNASLHYALHPFDTISKVFPLLKPHGVMYILDTPTYTNALSGEMMVRERVADFNRKFAFKLQTSSAGSFLTSDLIDRLRQKHRVQLLLPRYGLRRAVHDRIMPLLLGREPARFPIVKLTR